MAVKIKFDNNYNALPPTFVLATRNGTKLGPVPAVNIQLADNMNSYFELEFRVYKEDNGAEYALWDSLVDFKLLWCPEWDVWFEITVELAEEDGTYKNVSAVSLGEAELSQINLYTIEINTETDIMRDDYVPTVLYNEDKPEASLLNRIMEKAPHYIIKHVDEGIAHIQRTFTFDGTSLYDAFQEIAEEIDCIFIINSGSNDDGSIERSISVYDLESYCLDCGKRGDFVDTCPECGQNNIQHGYGEDTGIFICPDNLASNITYSVDTDSVKNCFKLVAGDELMTATVRNCNPNGSDYIWYISDEVKSDMSTELVEKLDSYNEQYEYYKNDYSISFDAGLVQKYNALVDKYKIYRDDLQHIPDTIVGYSALMNAFYDAIDFEFYLNDELMPDASMQSTDAGKEVAKLTTRNLSPVAVQDLKKCSAASATSAVLAMAKVLVDSRYRIKIEKDTFSSPHWSGQFILTNYSDDEDTATSEIVSVDISEDYEEFIRQKIDKALNDKTVDAVSLTELFKLDIVSFKAELHKYCLQRLISFNDGCQACIDILIEQGIANNETWADKNPNMYEEVYIPYRQKLLAIDEEMKQREEEIMIIAGSYESDGTLRVTGIQTLIDEENAKIQETLDFENYLGEELWLEFAAYRREDTYQNDNYISDGLNNTELFNNAREFLAVAEKDIYKSATLQHSITATLRNLLVMREFEPIVDYFCVGNWLRVQVDGKVYRLRLISYQIDFDNLDSLTVTFSDVKSVADGLTDSQSILDQAASMSSSYGSVSRQAGQGKKSAQRLGEWVERGLALTNMKIVGDADNQNITWDNHGILCKEYVPMFEEYDERQLKIINRGIYLTDDDWLTARAGIGNFLYYDPADGQTKESYGVIADTLIGNLILSKKVGIYNENNSITLDENGLTLKAYPYEGSTENSVFRIVNMKEEPGEDVVWIDENGNAHFKGEISATALTIYDQDFNDYYDERFETLFEVKDGQIQSKIESVEESLSDKIQEAENKAAEALAEQVMDFNSDIADLQKQLDKHVMTWFYDGVPTPSNEPAVDWRTTSDKEEHLGDLYYDTTPGFCYRWNKQGTTYLWEKVEDKDIIQSLQDAAKAQDTADHKRRVFFDTPVPPYDQGDMWVNADYSDGSVTYKNEILRCQTAQPEGGKFDIKHWILASKYTDDSYAKGVEVTLSTEITQTNEQIGMLAQRTTKVEGDYGDLETRVQSAEFKLTPDEIVQTVRDHKAYQNDFNGIGSRNYIINGNFADGTTSWGLRNYPATHDVVTQNGKNWGHIVGSTSTNVSTESFMQNAYKSHGITIEPGQSYTFSARVKGSKAGQIFQFGIQWIKGGNMSNILSQTWKEFTVGTSEEIVSCTSKSHADSDSFAIFVGTPGKTVGLEVYFTELKLERGEHYTDWSPAPEEVHNSMSRIEQTADMIKLLVQSGSSESSLKLTDKFIEVLTQNVVMTDELIQFVVGSDGIQDISSQAASAAENAKSAYDLATTNSAQLQRYDPAMQCLRFEADTGLSITAYNDEGKQSIWSTLITNTGFSIINNDLMKAVFYAYEDKCLVQNLEIGKESSKIKIIQRGTASGGVVWSSK